MSAPTNTAAPATTAGQQPVPAQAQALALAEAQQDPWLLPAMLTGALLALLLSVCLPWGFAA